MLAAAPILGKQQKRLYPPPSPLIREEAVYILEPAYMKDSPQPS